MNEEEKTLAEETPSDPFEQTVSEGTAPGSEKDIVPGQGLDLDNFGKNEPFLKGERAEDSAQGIPIEYDLKPEEATRALKYFQKKTIFKKNLIFTVILGIIAILYLQSVIADPSYTMGYILLVLSLTVIGFMWYLPARHIRSVAEALTLSHDTYHLEICADGLLLPQQDGKFLVGFDAPVVRAAEFPDLFLIIVSREKVFAIPKRCIDPERIPELSEMLKNALGGRYEIQPENAGKED